MNSEELCGVTQPSAVVLIVQGTPDGQTAGARAVSRFTFEAPKE